MSYVGRVPGSYWLWRPSFVSVQDGWRTLVTEFESGADQRRAKWTRPRAVVQLRFNKAELTANDAADIWRFYRAQQGAFRTFEVPTFGRIATVASAYPGSGTALGISDSQDFTSAAGSRWNRIWVENAAGSYEAWTVTSVVATHHVQVRSGSLAGTAFAVGNPVYPLLKARFADDNLSPEYLPALLTTLGIRLTEVHS